MATKAQAEISVILDNMRMKILVTKSILVGFFIVLVFLLLMIAGVIKSDWQSKTILGALDAILGYTMYPLVTHFFPALKQAKEAEARETNP
jgi:uncharacterized membrane protein